MNKQSSKDRNTDTLSSAQSPPKTNNNQQNIVSNELLIDGDIENNNIDGRRQ